MSDLCRVAGTWLGENRKYDPYLPSPQDAARWGLLRAYDINDRGQILGERLYQGGEALS